MRGVTPLAGPALDAEAAIVPGAADAPPPPAERPAPAQAPARACAPPLPELSIGAAPGLDRRNAERLRRGRLAIEARLDLHGMTQDEAHGALGAFLARSQEAGRRCVLVITGKGFRRGEEAGAGVLRAAVPRWLNEAPNRARLLAFAPAQPRDGGGGALYLLLKRRR